MDNAQSTMMHYNCRECLVNELRQTESEEKRKREGESEIELSRADDLVWHAEHENMEQEVKLFVVSIYSRAVPRTLPTIPLGNC